MKALLEAQKADLEPLDFNDWKGLLQVQVVVRHRKCGTEVAKVADLIVPDPKDPTRHAPAMLNRDDRRLGAVMMVQEQLGADTDNRWLLLERPPSGGLPRTVPAWCPPCGVVTIESAEIMAALKDARRTGKVRFVRIPRRSRVVS